MEILNMDTARLVLIGRSSRERVVATASAMTSRRAAAGVSAWWNYRYYGDTKELFRAVIARRTGAVLAAQQPHRAGPDSLTALRAWHDHRAARRRQLNHQDQGDGPPGRLARTVAGVRPEARADLAERFGRRAAALRRGLRAMHGRGVLSGKG